MFLTVLFSFNFYRSLKGSKELERAIANRLFLLFSSFCSYSPPSLPLFVQLSRQKMKRYITKESGRKRELSVCLSVCRSSQDPFFKNSWDDFDRLRQDMVKESKEFWNKAEAIQMEERPKTAEAAAPPPTPMFFPVRFEMFSQGHVPQKFRIMCIVIIPLCNGTIHERSEFV